MMSSLSILANANPPIIRDTPDPILRPITMNKNVIPSSISKATHENHIVVRDTPKINYGKEPVLPVQEPGYFGSILSRLTSVGRSTVVSVGTKALVMSGQLSTNSYLLKNVIGKYMPPEIRSKYEFRVSQRNTGNDLRLVPIKEDDIPVTIKNKFKGELRSVSYSKDHDLYDIHTERGIYSAKYDPETASLTFVSKKIALESRNKFATLFLKVNRIFEDLNRQTGRTDIKLQTNLFQEYKFNSQKGVFEPSVEISGSIKLKGGLKDINHGETELDIKLIPTREGTYLIELLDTRLTIAGQKIHIDSHPINSNNRQPLKFEISVDDIDNQRINGVFVRNRILKGHGEQTIISFNDRVNFNKPIDIYDGRITQIEPQKPGFLNRNKWNLAAALSGIGGFAYFLQDNAK